MQGLNEMKKEQLVDKIYNRILDKGLVMIEISARHIHLSKNDLETLFGKGHELNNVRDLSQKGQYLCAERVDIKGPKGTFKNVAILGPCRASTQLEVSADDARKIGLDAPIRLSGNTKESGSFTVIVGDNSINMSEGAIIAKRHIHVPSLDAKRLNLSHGEIVSVKVLSDDRGLTFENVVVRIDPSATFFMHIDTEETNASGISVLGYGLIKKDT